MRRNKSLLVPSSKSRSTTLLLMFSQMIVGSWVPLWSLFGKAGKTEKGKGDYRSGLLPGVLLGSAMVARGEIGLLIVQIGFNETNYVTKEGLDIAIWAILLNTIIGPVVVGLLIKFKGSLLAGGPWGTKEKPA